MSPLYLCMKLNFVSSVEDVPRTYIPVQWETSISPGRARTTVFNHGPSSKLGEIWNVRERTSGDVRGYPKGKEDLSSKTRTSGRPVLSDNASNISFFRCSARRSSLPIEIIRSDRKSQRADSREIPTTREYDLPLGYYSASSSQDGA